MATVPKDTISPFLRRLGARIRTLRDKQDMSQADLSKASGVSRMYLSRIERGISNFTVVQLERIAKGLKLGSPASLFEDR